MQAGDAQFQAYYERQQVLWGWGHGQKRPGLARLPPASTAGFVAGIRQRPEGTDFSP